MSILEQDVQDVRLQIAEHLRKNGTKQSWLCEKLNISGAHLSKILQARRKLTDELLKKINSLLNTNFVNTPANQNMKGD